MPGETFYKLIARNKRNSAILIVLFTLFFMLLGLLIGSVWGGGELLVGVIVAVIAGVVAGLITMTSYFAGTSAVLSISHARAIERPEDPQLFNVVEELAIAAGIPPPKIYVIDDSAPNAFATGRNPRNAVVAITTGLRQKLTRDELQGVMAHEISHVRNDDILFAMLMAVMVGVIVMLVEIFLRSLRFMGGGRRSRDSGGGGGGGAGAILFLILLVLAILLALLAPILSRLIQAAMSRQREYLADASGVELTRNPLGLANALAKISADPDVLEVASKATAHLYIVHPIKKFEERASTMMDSHPPIQDRIARLMSLVQ